MTAALCRISPRPLPTNTDFVCFRQMKCSIPYRLGRCATTLTTGANEIAAVSYLMTYTNAKYGTPVWSVCTFRHLAMTSYRPENWVVSQVVHEA